MMRSNFVKGVVVFLLFAFTVPAESALTEERLLTFLDGSGYRNVRLSPDGKHISLITQQDDRDTLVIMNLETMQPTASVQYTEATNMEIASASWLDNDTVRYHITRQFAMYEQRFFHPDVFLLKTDGSRNTRIWSIAGNYENNSSSSSREKGELTRGFPNFLTEHPRNKDEYLIYVRSFARRDGAGRGGIYRLDLRSGDTKEYAKVPHFTQTVISNEDASVFVAGIGDRNADQSVMISNGDDNWRPLEHDLAHLHTEFAPTSIRGNYVYATTQSGDAIDAPTVVIRYDIENDQWEEVFNIGFAIFEGGHTDRETGEPVFIRWNDGEPQMEVLDKSNKIGQVVNAFTKNYAGFNVNVVSVTEEQDKILLHISSGAHVGEYFLFDFNTRQAKFLLASNDKIDGNELSDIQDATFVASDGVTIPGWFQAPKGVEEPPLILYIHGGPHGPYEDFGFSTIYHLINEMGYAVYAPNFRGSGGYGPNFRYSGYGQWGSRMIDDMYEGVQALIEAGKVNPDRVCTMGWSYGGYGSLQSLVRHNDFYKCGVVLAGVFDLTTMMKLTDISGMYSGKNFMAKAIGDDPEIIREFSPMQNIDRINAPMLIHHGKEDERTPFKDAELFVEALKKSNKRFEYKWYAKEGHGNANLDNQIDEFLRIQTFLKENL